MAIFVCQIRIEMKKFFLIISIIALTISNIFAGPVDQKTAQRIGDKFMKTTSLANKADIQSTIAYTYGTREQAEIYIFNIKGGGFVVVSAEDAVKPILAYATTGSFSSTDIADGFDFTMQGFREEIQYVRDHNIAATSDITAEWKSIEETGYIRQNRNQKTVDILLASTWNQNFPYNNQCPEDPEGNGGYVYAGCVATAMGQVINYYKHPARGTGSHSYTPGGWGYPSYPTQTANFGQTDYHFELMPNDLDSLSSDTEIFYIAQLLHHLGISVDMMYSPDGSGAYSFSVPGALSSYFGFTGGNLEDKNGYYGGGYSNEEWINMLKTELDQRRPLYYSGSDDSGAGGHAFVCDGYDENDYFHFNWGWSGRDNAYCAIGALNTTKYAFNTNNSALFECYPQNGNYASRPAKINDMALTEKSTFDGVTLTWTNPALDNDGNALTSLDTVFVRRNFQVVATFANPEIGGTMTYTDDVPESRIYEYSIYAKNASGASIPVYEKILVGETCDIVFQLNDEGGNGWKGAAISVTNNGNRIGIITMKEGAQETVTVPLLKGELNFIWNHGWYHNNQQYNTDFECSYTIFDANGNQLYTSPEELSDGVFLTHNNNCDGTLICYEVQSLQSEYTWTSNEELGITITWNKPTNTENLDRFKIYRQDAVNKDFELIAEVPADGSDTYTYYDDLTGHEYGMYLYQVTAVYVKDSEQCESEPATTSTAYTGVDENSKTARVYPNPTSGMLNIEAVGTMNITVSNMLGQVLASTTADDKTAIDMSRYETGCYIVRIQTANSVKIEKVSVR